MFNISLIYFYLRTKQFSINVINKFQIYLIGIKEIRILTDNQQKNIISRYFIYRSLNYFVKIFDNLKNLSIIFRDKFEINADKVHITKITEYGEKTIIIEKDKTKYLNFIGLKDISDYIINIQLDDNMLNCVIINFDLVNSDYDKICLKRYLIKYKDIEEKYDNTLKNIILFNNLNYLEGSEIKIKLYKNKKLVEYNLLLHNVWENHINYFINIS